MGYLILSILSSTLIFVTFKIAGFYSCKLFNIIILNYLTATFLGLAFLMDFTVEPENLSAPWMPFAFFVGLLFIVIFFIIGLSSQKAGIAITTVASKMSMVIPVLFSILYFSEKIYIFKIIGLLTAVVAVFLSLYKKDKKNYRSLAFLLPLIIFIGSGLVDSLVKFAQQVKIPDSQTSEFATSVFAISFLLGLIILLFKPQRVKGFVHLPTLLLGMLLGLSNYGSLFFLIKALGKSGIDSSLVFTINNMSIVLISVLTGFLIFREKLSKINFVGIALGFFSLFLLSYF